MSMLAERKVKQKWSLNPRGKVWSEDSNKFGQKMLEKMGWSKGKGLGAKENGIVEHVKVSYKNDSKGMGYKDTNDQWTEHDTNFNALLQSLSGAAPSQTDVKLTSLERKSQSSKVRVHYKKFTRGKDLSRCSEKDLASIFGKKSLNAPTAPIEEVEEEKEETKNEGFLYSGGSMLDYFKKKLPNYGKSNGYVVGSNGVLKYESDEEEARVGFGFEKKRKGEEINGTPKKKKKEEEEKGLSNPAFDPLLNNVVVKKHVLNTIEEESDDVQLEEGYEEDAKIKKQGRPNEENEVTSDSAGRKMKTREDQLVEKGNEDAKNHKKKKKKGTNDAADNPNFDEIEEINGPTNDTFEVKRKKKKDKSASVLDNPNFDENEEINGLTNDTFEVKRKRKKNKSASALDNPSFDISDSCENFSNDIFEVKRKKKKDKSASALDSPSFDIADGRQNGANETHEVRRKRKKDKSESALDNPCFDLSDSCQSAPNDAYEIKRKKKNKSASAVDNPSFDMSDSCQNAPNDTYEVKRMKIDKNALILDNRSFDISDCQNGNDTFEVKRKKRTENNSHDFEVKRKKKEQDESLAIDNPNFDISDRQDGYVDSAFEVKRKKKKDGGGAVDNPTFEDSPVKNEELSFDLILNVTNTPTAPKTPKKQSSVKRRKSVRFSEVNEERIIPNNEDVENRNDLFDINSRVIANGLRDTLDLDDISKKLDGCQAEVENDINEAKVVSKYIGEVGNPNGDNEKLPEGTRLKFRFANFGRSPSYLHQKTTRAKSSYKHLIKGDIILGFNNTNLHEIVGYGVNKTK